MDTTKSGYVYVLQMEGHDYYKIGRTVNLTRRIAEISPQMPGRLRLVFALKVRDAWRSESILHDDFKAARMNGEWFRLNTDDLIQIRLHLLVDQAFSVTEKLVNRLSREAFDGTVSLVSVSRVAALISKSALRSERRVQRYFTICFDRPRPVGAPDEILDAEVVL